MEAILGRVRRKLRERRPCYTARFPMSAKLKPGKKKVTTLEMVARAALPTRYGRFTIYGFKGRDPQEEAVPLVRGNLYRSNTPLVLVHSRCLTGDLLPCLTGDYPARLELFLKKIR